MKKRLAFIVAGLTLIMLIVSADITGSAHADAGCEPTYRVRRGDTLSSIAAAFGADVSTLARLNDIPNPDLIRAGRVLCLPEPLQVIIELIEQFGIAPPVHEMALPVRTPLTLAQRYDTPEDLRTALAGGDVVQPVLLLSRPGPFPIFNLVVIGDTDLFVQLGLEKPDGLTNVNELARTDTLQPPEQGIYVHLQPPGGVGFSYAMAAVEYSETWSPDLLAQHANVYLTLAATDFGLYELAVVADRELFESGLTGPPGERVKAQCGRWQGRRGFIFRFLRALYGCR